MCQFDAVQKIFEIILTETADNHKKTSIYYLLGRIKEVQEKYVEVITFYEKSLAIKQKILPPNRLYMSTSAVI
jgi:hypothetical protein